MYTRIIFGTFPTQTQGWNKAITGASIGTRPTDIVQPTHQPDATMLAFCQVTGSIGLSRWPARLIGRTLVGNRGVSNSLGFLEQDAEVDAR
jgi:hypothetical protein